MQNKRETIKSGLNMISNPIEKRSLCPTKRFFTAKLGTQICISLAKFFCCLPTRGKRKMEVHEKQALETT